MRGPLPEKVRRVAEVLADEAGGYLRNTIREPGVTCAVCSVPVDSSYERCYWCNEHSKSGPTVADRVASMVYAVEPRHELDQMYKVMRGYKASPPIDAHERVVASLLALGLRGHAACDIRLSGRGAYQWAVVPSTRVFRYEHPLHRMVTTLAGGTGSEVAVTAVPGKTDYRRLDPNHFVVGPVTRGGHVAVVDDSWVQGGHAQSVAAALRKAGAASVSIMTVARVLDPTFGANKDFIRRRLLKTDFDPSVCPWTGGACP